MALMNFTQVRKVGIMVPEGGTMNPDLQDLYAGLSDVVLLPERFELGRALPSLRHMHT